MDSEILNKIKTLTDAEIVKPDFLSVGDVDRFSKSVIRLLEMKNVLIRATTIASLVDVPLILLNGLREIADRFIDCYSSLASFTSKRLTNEVVTSFEQACNKIEDYYNQFFEISSGARILQILNSINTYGNELTKGADEKVTSLIKQLGDEIKKAGLLNKEISEKASKIVISDYAGIFETQEKKFRASSNWWLGVAIILTLGFIILFIMSIFKEWFQITTTLTSNDSGKLLTQQVFNYPLLISKIVIISFIIFIITFCFRQYSINKNLEVVNQHRKNAINSYKLFEASISDKDVTTKHALMLQLAKSIYEMTHSGFLSSDKSNSNSGQIFEWTKLVSDPNK